MCIIYSMSNEVISERVHGQKHTAIHDILRAGRVVSETTLGGILVWWAVWDDEITGRESE